MSVFDILCEQIDAADLAKRFTELKRAGNLLKGCCPVHQDSTPSFVVYSDNYHCFGCGFHGDVVDLWAKMKGFEPGIEAALDLAREYNIKLPAKDPDAQRKAEEQREKEASFEQQAKACHQNLEHHPHIVEWLEQRGFNEELRQSYLLGANRDGTSAVLPFWRRGRVKSLIRRQLDREPKYLLQKAEEFPEGYKPLFIVGSAHGDAHLVEGFFDAVSLAGLGYYSIAVGGTGINPQQKAELQRIKGTIYIFPDNDERGAKASRIWVRELYPNARLCPAEYGEGRKDVNDLFAAEGENAKPILEELKKRSIDALDIALAEAPPGSTREKWRYAQKQVLPLLAELKDEGERKAAICDAAKALGIKTTDLQSALKPEVKAQDKQANEPATLELLDPELWSDEVDGSELLDDLVSVIRRYVSAPDGIPETIALWSLYSHVFDAFEISPLLAVTSPEKRCGKTTLLMLVSMLVPRPLPVANISSSALFRAVEKFQPTLLIDEADTFLAGNEELRGIINSGHRRAMAYVIRSVGDDHEPHLFCTWSPKAIALIGAMPDTIEDRAISIRMQRRRAGEETEELRLDRLSALESFRQKAARWAADNFDLLKVANPDIPSNITNARARDNWRVMLAVADAAGGHWPALARETALKFTSAEPETESTKIILLHDLKAIFEEHGERLESEKIVTALIDIEGRPWAEGKNGKPLSKTGLARLLKPFNIHPCPKWREGDKAGLRGYQRSDFDEVFARYLESETPQTPHATESTTYSQNETPHDPPVVAFENNANSNGHNAVASVASRKAEEMGFDDAPEGFEWRSIEGVNVLIAQTDGSSDEDENLAECLDFFDEASRDDAVITDFVTDEQGTRYEF